MRCGRYRRQDLRTFDAVNEFIHFFWSFCDRTVGNGNDAPFRTKFAESFDKLLAPFVGNRIAEQEHSAVCLSDS